MKQSWKDVEIGDEVFDPRLGYLIKTSEGWIDESNRRYTKKLKLIKKGHPCKHCVWYTNALCTSLSSKHYNKTPKKRCEKYYVV